MKTLINNNVKNIIRDTLKLDEALSSQEKQFQINTDFLSNDNIENHKELYRGYIDNFNKSNLKLDSVEKAKSNSNHCSIQF